MWKVLSGEETISKRVFSHLLEVLNLSLPYQEKHKGSKIVRYATDTPHIVSIHFGLYMYLLITVHFQATMAISVLCTVEETGPVANEFFSKVLSALVLRVGVSSTIETDPKSLSCTRSLFIVHMS